MSLMSPSVVRAQLERIARSPTFAHAGRMFPLLEYLVGAGLDARDPAPDQRRIAIDVFGRDETFDPGCDAIVRVEVGRLRNKLREYYATDGCADALIVDVPRGQYRASIRPRSGFVDGSVPAQTVHRCTTPDGVSIAYSVIGHGHPLVLLPHWMSHLEVDLETPLFRHYWVELSRRFRLVRFDSRGLGLSDRVNGDYSFDDLVADLGTVVDTLGLEHFALLGPSASSLIATAYAARQPARVSHLVLLGGFIRGGRRTDVPVAVETTDALESMIRLGWARSSSTFRKVFCSMLVPDGTPEQYRWMDAAQLASSTPANALHYFRTLHDVDLSAEARHIDAPTLVLHGDRDTAVPIAEAEHTARAIPGARLVRLPTNNHVLLGDEPAWPLFLSAVDELTSGGNTAPEARTASRNP